MYPYTSQNKVQHWERKVPKWLTRPTIPKSRSWPSASWATRSSLDRGSSCWIPPTTRLDSPTTGAWAGPRVMIYVSGGRLEAHPPGGRFPRTTPGRTRGSLSPTPSNYVWGICLPQNTPFRKPYQESENKRKDCAHNRGNKCSTLNRMHQILQKKTE